VQEIAAAQGVGRRTALKYLADDKLTSLFLTLDAV
jgi:hypothetical protein